jgi:endonuclease/exonuclease/phosphatase family metal-dependent hydrolase
VEAIASALGLRYVYFPASRHPKTQRDFGNAILSPWPISETRKLLLPGRSRGVGQARAAVVATVEVHGRPVVVYSVHLTSLIGMGGGGRARQAEAVLEDAQRAPHPVIVAGDFNSGSVGERFLKAGFEWPTRKVGKSAGPFAYDHILTRGLKASGPGSAGVAKAGPKASDHWPVWAVFPWDASADPLPLGERLGAAREVEVEAAVLAPAHVEPHHLRPGHQQPQAGAAPPAGTLRP